MKNRRFQFWIYFSLGWLFYTISLTAVFIQKNYSVSDILLSLLNNVLPAVLLGIAAVKICQKIQWSLSLRFIIIQLLLAFLFAFLWGSVTLILNSLYIQASEWEFILSSGFTLQWQLLSGLMAYFTIVSAVYIWEFNENLRSEEKRNAELQILAAQAESARRQAELFALRSQLNPHFLFNTLHSVMELVRTDTAAAETAIERFSDMLRYVLHSQETNGRKTLDVSFDEELAFIENYLDLEKMRLGKRLQIKFEVENTISALRLPAFLVQPLVENAVNRGISSRVSGGIIWLKAYLQDDFFYIIVNDNGIGAKIEEIAIAKGFGLRLIRQTLSLKYGNKADLQIETSPNQGFTATIKIPCER